jgi:hypothetical protein
MSTATIKPLHSRIRSGQTRPGDDRRFAKALGIDPSDARFSLCSEALAGSVDAALDLWRSCLPGRPLRIQVEHTPSALRMCAHLLTEVRPA